MPNRFPNLKMLFSAMPAASRSAVAGIVITAAYFAFILLCVVFTYGTNDDIAIVQMIRAGDLVPYVDSTYSSILHFLYAHVSGDTCWYAIWLLGVLGISTAALLGLAIHYHIGYLRYLLVLVILGTLFPFVAKLDYSAIGILGGGAAVAIAMVLIARDALTPPRAFLLGLLGAVAMWARLESVLAVAVFTLPAALLFLLMRLRGRWTTHRPGYAALLLLAAPLLISSGVDRLHKTEFSSPQYREYSAWNSLRGDFHSSPAAGTNSNNPAVLAATGWSKADYARLTSWFFTDERLYNVQSMTAFFQTAKSPPLDSYTENYFSWRLDHLEDVYWFYWVSMIGLFLLAASARPVGIWRCLMLACCPLFVFGFIYATDALFRFPSRVAVPSLSAFMLVYAFMAGELQSDAGPRRPPVAAYWSGMASRIYAYLCKPPDDSGLLISARLLLVASIAMIAWGLYNVVQAADDEQMGWGDTVIRFTQIMDHLNHDYAGSYILIQPQRGLWTEFQSPGKPFSMKFNPISVGWETFSPLFYAQIKGLGIDKGYQLPLAMVNNKDAFMLANRKWSNLAVAYLHEHGGMPRAHKEIVEKISKNLYMYRLVNP